MKQGIIQALLLGIYITLVGLFIWNANHILGPINNFSGPILFLLLFSTSALICGLIVFYKPYKLFMNGKKTEALRVVIATTVGLFIMLLLVLSGILFLKF